MTQSPPPLPPEIAVTATDPARRSPIPYECAGRTGTLFWRTVWMVICRTGCMFSPDAFLPLPKRSRSFRRWAVFLAVLGLAGHMLCSAIVRTGMSAGLSDMALVMSIAAPAGFGVLYCVAFTLMMRVVHWLSVPAHAPRERQWQALVRSDYLSAPLVLFVTLLLTPLGFLLGEDAYRTVAIVGAGQTVVIGLYWLVVVLVGLQHLTGRSGGAMVWAGARLILAWLTILESLLALPLSAIIWVLVVGTW